jgi:hypothetical protein
MKLKLSLGDNEKYDRCVNWLAKNVGPLTYSPGLSLNGEGWYMMYQFDINDRGRQEYVVELCEYVDDQTKAMFALSFA